MFKYSVISSHVLNLPILYPLCTHDVTKVCGIKYLTADIELVLPNFKFWTVSQNYRIFNVKSIA